MPFIQIIEMDIPPSRYGEARQLEEDWRRQTEGERTVLRSTWCQDRAVPNRYVSIVEFASHEDAMRNNELPATKEFARRMADFVSNLRYHDLDVDRVEVG